MESLTLDLWDDANWLLYDEVRKKNSWQFPPTWQLVWRFNDVTSRTSTPRKKKLSVVSRWLYLAGVKFHNIYLFSSRKVQTLSSKLHDQFQLQQISRQFCVSSIYSLTKRRLYSTTNGGSSLFGCHSLSPLSYHFVVTLLPSFYISVINIAKLVNVVPLFLSS